jgi:hypothetical protein
LIHLGQRTPVFVGVLKNLEVEPRMSLKSWFTGSVKSDVKEVKDKVEIIEKKVAVLVGGVLDAAEKEAPVLEKDLAPVVSDEKQILKGAILQALQDSKSELKNSEPGLSADAEKAVEAVIAAAVQVMIKDGMGAL